MATPAPVRSIERRSLANLGHLIVVLMILAAIIYFGYRSQRNAVAAPSSPAAAFSPARAFAISMALEWALLLYVWGGVRRHGGRMSDLTGGRWSTWRQVVLDLAIFVPFWLFWTLTARAIWWLLHPPLQQGANFNFPPHGGINIAAWLGLSVTAGFCEEVLYRGYLQRQFYAFTGSVVAAVLL